MKKVLLIAGLAVLAFAGKASAGVFDPDMIRSSATAIGPISVSSYTATAIDSAARLMEGRFLISISNEGSDAIRCGFDVGVSSTSRGFLIPAAGEPGSTWTQKLKSTINVWCMATGLTPINVSLMQGKGR